MKADIKLTPVNQTGQNCKITAIATVEKYFAEQLGFKPIPLHKKKTSLLSIRQVSKTKGSRQGELLEARQFSDIFSDLGYETEWVDFQDDYPSFQKHVIQSIHQGNLVIACFEVNPCTGDPSPTYKGHEHAAVLHGFDDKTNELQMIHWDRLRRSTMGAFFQSSMVLLTQRRPEYYVNCKRSNKEMKYDLYFDQTGRSFPEGENYRESLMPKKDSGFRGKLLVIKRPELQKIHEARKILFNTEIINNLFSELKIKTDELIRKGNIMSRQHSQYEAVSSSAEKLMTRLEDAKMLLLIDKKITLVEFKEKCVKAIDEVKDEFKVHRGFHQVMPILRIILGILAALAIIPGLVVSFKARKGYIGTFFETPKTDSEEKLESFSQGLNHLE